VSFLDHAGAVAVTIVKHVPARGMLWGGGGFVIGAICVLLSYGAGVLVVGRGALLLGYLAAIPIAIPFLGAALFFVHGLHRGAARAALELERRFSLVRYVVSRALETLERAVGGPISNLPLQRVEDELSGAVDALAKKTEGTGLAAWVVTRAKRAVMPRLRSYLLTAYRAELQADGSGGGVALAKVAARVEGELAANLGELVMSPLDKQLVFLACAYVAVAAGWWFWLFLLARLIGGTK
jgi:hypothetical protein